ncbi:cytochrome P450 family protein [Rhizoctonia solani]|uniref:Cytochrome P450 family protein n=1 Tax=Rhizoctonia solani TaxID=456999 RepID=A0A8H8NZX4_9AGAM|nr:cytochrome P450 family protein [Rhizoctonia solani]QRW22645.1 cytochrome P450 family protein [Rhizoctonia solani]
MDAVMFTNFYVNIFPILAHVPDWAPGAGWKRTIRRWRDQKARASLAPLEWTKAQIEAGVSQPSLLGMLLEEDLTPGISIEERDRRLKEIGLALYAGGTVALPHVCLEDDKFKGFDILKGTIVFGNIWAMSRDESIYSSPETFDPERFLDSQLPQVPAFGWGRRRCPGASFGENSVFIAIASLLATFTFSSPDGCPRESASAKLENTSNSLFL